MKKNVVLLVILLGIVLPSLLFDSDGAESIFEQKTEVKIEPVQKGPAVRDHEVLVSVKEGQRKVVENTIFNKEVRISFNDYDSVAIFKDCTFNDRISVSGDYDLDESLIFENCKIKGDIIEIPKWK